MKPRIIFLHGLKTGGTSLRSMLLKEYGYAQVAPVPIGNSRFTQDYPVLKIVQPLDYQHYIQPADVAGYGVVMGHYDWDIVDSLPDWQVITLLRHPVDQIVSLYQYMRDSADFPNFKPVSFMDWVRGAGRVYLNHQVKLLSGHRVPSLDRALANLADKRLSFGMLEFFEDTVERWNTQFGWSLKVEHRNKAAQPLELSAKDYWTVCGLQAEDMVLYEAALSAYFDPLRPLL